MSRAFIKETDLEHAGIDIPERPISPEINYVTPYGLKELKIQILNKKKYVLSEKLGIFHPD